MTCWLNSVLQAVLIVLDHDQDAPAVNDPSPLYIALLSLKQQDLSSALDPSPIKDIIYEAERQRILTDKVIPQNRLFHFAGTKSMTGYQLARERLAGGQQDCKDFFVCLKESLLQWPDVYSLFHFNLKPYTVCRNCGGQSTGVLSSNCFMLIDCPSRATTMSEHIVSQMQNPTSVPQWIHEDGCKKQGGQKYSAILNIKEVRYLIFIVTRLNKVRKRLVLNHTRAEVGGNIKLKDSLDQEAEFEPIAVIHHQGQVSSNNDTSGHYRADVLHPQSRQWFQTSDDEAPRLITQPSNKGYILIYKKLS